MMIMMMMQISIYPFCGRITEIHQQRYHREDEHAENLWIRKLFSVDRYFLILTPILRIWSKSRIVYFTNILPARVWPEISSPAQFFACKPEYFVTNIFWIANQNILLQKYFLSSNNICWWVLLPASRFFLKILLVCEQQHLVMNIVACKIVK